MDLKEVELLGGGVAKHWYYQSKAAALIKVLPPGIFGCVLDVGAGSAFFSRFLVEKGLAREVWCVDTCYSEDRDDVFLGSPFHYRRSPVVADADLVLLMDVLEHVDDDVGLLSEYVKRAPLGAKFVISVPAFQFLWSRHDVFLEHKRRYHLSEIERVCSDAGLSLRAGCYYFGGVFPAAAAVRLLARVFRSGESPASDLRQHKVWLNSFLRKLCSIELPLMRFNRAFGLTAFCVAEKV